MQRSSHAAEEAPVAGHGGHGLGAIGEFASDAFGRPSKHYRRARRLIYGFRLLPG
jgi:hypothetical protein